MSRPRHTRYHPRWHRDRFPIFWWLGKSAYTKFIARELTSLAVAYSALLLLAEVWALGRGQEAALRQLLTHPAMLVVHGVVLLALVFHTVTWLHLAPQALVLKVGGRRVPDLWIVIGHYLAWGAASAVVVALLLGVGA